VNARTRILVLSSDPIVPEMGGNAIRASELANVLAAHGVVTLASPAAEGRSPHGLPHVSFDPANPHELPAADVVLTTPHSPVTAAWLQGSGARVIYDLYDPFPLSVLEAFAGASPLHRRMWTTLALDSFVEALHNGHHFVCASERQRGLWIGAMLGLRLINERAYRRDPSFRSVIDVVPFGLTERAPRPDAGPGVRDRFPDIADEDEIVLWNGGLWNWLDPRTAVRAAGLLAERRQQSRLVFMGPGPSGEGGREAHGARALARELGLLDRVVFFNDRRVPYAEREAWLLEADCALSAHQEHLETYFSFRSRLLDCFWSGLPVVCTEGDELSELIAREDLGAAVAPGDAEAAAAALEAVLERGRAGYRDALARVAEAYTWPRVAAPLVRFATSNAAPAALGAPLDRRLGRPVQRGRALGTRLVRRVLRTRR
jgi:glycosyltransferase involved in cell wall biosynthesis